MDQYGKLNGSKAGEGEALFGDERADGPAQGTAGASSVKASQSLFDDQFESKVSIWKSFREEKSEHARGLDEDLLDNPVLDTSPPGGPCASGGPGPVPTANRFWDAGTPRKACPGSWREAPGAAREKRGCPADSALGGSSAGDLAAIAPKILQKLMFEDERPAAKSSCEASTHPCLEDVAGSVYESKRPRTGGDIGPGPKNGEGGVSLGESSSTAVRTDVGGGADRRGHPSFAHGVIDRTAQCADSGPAPSFEARSDFMDTNRSLGMTQEIVQNLESKIKTLSTQIDNYRQAVASKENIIRDLSLQLELHSKSVQDIDCEYVQTYARQGMEILDRMRSRRAPRDLTGEVQSLKIENLSLRNIVDELAMRIRHAREPGCDP